MTFKLEDYKQTTPKMRRQDYLIRDVKGIICWQDIVTKFQGKNEEAILNELNELQPDNGRNDTLARYIVDELTPYVYR